MRLSEYDRALVVQARDREREEVKAAQAREREEIRALVAAGLAQPLQPRRR